MKRAARRKVGQFATKVGDKARAGKDSVVSFGRDVKDAYTYTRGDLAALKKIEREVGLDDDAYRRRVYEYFYKNDYDDFKRRALWNVSELQFRQALNSFNYGPLMSRRELFTIDDLDRLLDATRQATTKKTVGAKLGATAGVFAGLPTDVAWVVSTRAGYDTAVRKIKDLAGALPFPRGRTPHYTALEQYDIRVREGLTMRPIDEFVRDNRALIERAAKVEIVVKRMLQVAGSVALANILTDGKFLEDLKNIFSGDLNDVERAITNLLNAAVKAETLRSIA